MVQAPYHFGKEYDGVDPDLSSNGSLDIHLQHQRKETCLLIQ